MNNTLNNAVIQATKETFRQVIGCAIESSSPQVKDMNGDHTDTSVIISFVGSISGAFTLRCSKELGASLASRMLGCEIEPESADMKDAVGELLNMVVGSTKTYMATDGDPFKMSVPTTIVGGDYTLHIKAAANAKVTLIPFSCDNDELSIEVYVN